MPFRIGRERGEALQSSGALMGLGFAFVISIVLGAGGGYLLDRWLGTAPWLFFLGFILGFAAAVITVYRTVGPR